MSLTLFLLISTILFSIGLIICITKKNAIVVLMGIELMLNAANINFVAMSRFNENISGQYAALFVIVIAAAEASVALAIVIKLYQYFKTVDLDRINKLKG